ncbi:MAG: hypothetical protein ACP5O7_11710 [Phycisphaerae bacterium]
MLIVAAVRASPPGWLFSQLFCVGDRRHGDLIRLAAVAAMALGSAGMVLAGNLALGVHLPGGRYLTIVAYVTYTGALICAGAGVYATGVAKAAALWRFGRQADGRPPRWGRVVGRCPQWVRWVSKADFAAMLAYAAIVWLETWHRRDSFTVAKLGALFVAFTSALAWNSAVVLLSAAT